jgi:hypothetical protein
MTIVSSVNLNPYRSEIDCKDYLLVTLSNGLRALLVSSAPLLTLHEQKKKTPAGKDDNDGDMTSIKAAAALAVQVGSFSDPLHVEGAAHYLEVSLTLSRSLSFSFSLSLSQQNILSHNFLYVQIFSTCYSWVPPNIPQRIIMMPL